MPRRPHGGGWPPTFSKGGGSSSEESASWQQQWRGDSSLPQMREATQAEGLFSSWESGHHAGRREPVANPGVSRREEEWEDATLALKEALWDSGNRIDDFTRRTTARSSSPPPVSPYRQSLPIARHPWFREAGEPLPEVEDELRRWRSERDRLERRNRQLLGGSVFSQDGLLLNWRLMSGDPSKAEARKLSWLRRFGPSFGEEADDFRSDSELLGWVGGADGGGGSPREAAPQVQDEHQQSDGGQGKDQSSAAGGCCGGGRGVHFRAEVCVQQERGAAVAAVVQGRGAAVAAAASEQE